MDSNPLNRRELLALGGSVAAIPLWMTGVPAAEAPPPEHDHQLRYAIEHPGAFMHTRHATSQCETRGELIITSARNLEGKPEPVRVRSGTMAIFRADSDVDDFTRQGGWYWRCRGTEGKSQFENYEASGFDHPGMLMMVVYQHDLLVHWYSLMFDVRC